MKINLINQRSASFESSQEIPNCSKRANMHLDRIEQCSDSSSKSEGCCHSIMACLKNLWKCFLDFILCRKSEEVPDTEEEKGKEINSQDLGKLYPEADPNFLKIIQSNPTFIERQVFNEEGPVGFIKISKLRENTITYDLWINEHESIGNISFTLNKNHKAVKIDKPKFAPLSEKKYCDDRLNVKQLFVAQHFLRLGFEISQASGFNGQMLAQPEGNYAAVLMLNGFSGIDIPAHNLIRQAFFKNKNDFSKIDLGNNKLDSTSNEAIMWLHQNERDIWEEAIAENKLPDFESIIFSEVQNGS